MLGLGPITEGYSLIATAQHVRSLIDLTAEQAAELVSFTEEVRTQLRQFYGPVVVAEHGRVPPCEVDEESGAREQHCFHAHRLVFPVETDLTAAMRSAALTVQEFPDFLTCWREFSWPDEYLYFERADGTCAIASAPLPVARQFFRTRIAEVLGRPEFASWRLHPRLEVVEAARSTLRADKRRK